MSKPSNRDDVEQAWAEAGAAIERRFRALIEHTTDIITVLDASGVVRYESPSIERVTGYTPGELIGEGALDLVHPDDRLRVQAAIRRLQRRPGGLIQEEFRIRHKDGSWRVLEGTGANLLDDPLIQGLVYTGRDVTERKREEEAQRFLAEVSRVLGPSLDSVDALEEVAELTTGRLAELCIIDLMDEAGAARRVAAAASNAEAAELVSLLGTSPGRGIIARALTTGEPQRTEELCDDWLDVISTEPRPRRVLRELAPAAVLVVPLIAHEHRLGWITLVSLDAGRRYDARDTALVAEAGRRVATAIEHARLYEAALSASEAKSDFLALISHELRTPLNAIMGYTELLQSTIPGPLTPKQREHLHSVQSNARHLLGLIEAILTYTRLEAGREYVLIERADLNDVVRDAASLIEPTAVEKGLSFRLVLPDTPIPSETDPAKVKQLVLNLLTNAVKFTDTGEIVVAAEADDEFARIRVHDTGVGIPREARERVFSPFWQAEETTTRRAGGAGLGLSVARGLARVLGGDILIESTPGQGSTFTLRIPLRHGQRLAAPTDRSTPCRTPHGAHGTPHSPPP